MSIRLSALPVGVLAVALTASAGDQRLAGRVIRITDGDTFMMVSGSNIVEVRLFGVDCPEMGQPYGAAAKRFTTERLADRTVDVTGVTTDQYGRLVGRVRVSGRDMGLELLRAGLAWHLSNYSPDETLAYAERHARAWRIGLWSQANPVPPWMARHRQADARSGGGPGFQRLPDTASDGASRAHPRTGSDDGPFRGNVRSRVFHRPGCRNYYCKACTQVFATRDEAIRLGYTPARCCKP